MNTNKLFADDQEIEDIIQQDEKDSKNVKIKEVSQKEDKSDNNNKGNTQNEILSIDPMRQSQKMSVINTFNSISSDFKGNTEAIVLRPPSFPK
jgi:hypothetical protein